MAKFKLKIMNHKTYDIFDSLEIECTYEELLQRTALELDERIIETGEPNYQAHIYGKWPNGKKLCILVFSN